MVTYAIVGASKNREKYGNRVLRFLQERGDDVVAINPNAIGAVEGARTYPSLSVVQGRVDRVIFVVPPESTLAIIDELDQLDIRWAWFQPGSESDAARSLCEEKNIECTMGACIMVTR